MEAQSSAESRVQFTLSIMMVGDPSRSTEVNCLRHSSGSRGAENRAPSRPLTMSETTSDNKVLPLPCAVASNSANGVGPLIAGRQTGVQHGGDGIRAAGRIDKRELADDVVDHFDRHFNVIRARFLRSREGQPGAGA